MRSTKGTNKGTTRSSAVWGSGKIGALVAAVVAAVALAAPGTAGASGTTLPSPNTSMIVDVSTTTTGVYVDAVSWSDVSWDG